MAERTVDLLGHHRRAIGALACLAAVALMVSAPAAAQVRAVPRSGGNAVLSRLKLTVNKSQTIKVDSAFADVLVGSSEIADVVPISDRTIYLLGKKTGTTNVSLIDAEKRLVGLLDIEVRPDVEAITSQVRQSTGQGSLTVGSQGDRLILGGVASDGPAVDRAMQVAPPGTINLTRVKSPQQVMLKVRFVEVNRTAGREIGARFEFGGPRTLAAVGNFGGLNQATSTQNPGTGLLSGLVGTAVSAATTGGVPFGTLVQSFGGSSRQLDVFISALETRGLLRRLAEPNLIAQSGERAEFLAGGEIPIPIANQTFNGSPQITVSYKEFGVRLAFTPTVLRNGQINLQLEPEVSQIDPTLAVGVGGGVSVPGLTKRRARTSVELRDGQSFAIAGLLQTQSTRTIEQLPWLGSVPVLGALFRSPSFQDSETELVVIVTPALVNPAKPGQVLASPLDTTLPANDVDLFVNGKMEIARDTRTFVTSRGGAIGPHGHIVPAPEAGSQILVR
ncbi:type II and III secretion system protein family protein [Methylobacterium sp. J-059]|uniref:type II and III secretion system protein family protein n=1 Tax=Methylobacterium sp. J-059 TaxID=2836643 RepID=UPI001FBAF5EA|nr:type II and III secretion system protein family protein [Methylobacterium sp. J-059]MCJ2039278.1 type II and III secretion system protein family protein [Methylobacterium sp. J-059]